MLPYYHILPASIYKGILKLFKENESRIEGLLEVKSTGITIERFEKILKENNYNIEERMYYFINPNYEVKFGLKPRKGIPIVSSIPGIKNFVTTSAYYLISMKEWYKSIMIIKEITEATPQVHEAIERLLKQLTKKSILFSMKDFQEIVKTDSAILLGAFENSILVGMLTLVIIKIPVGMQCRIEDVVVDKTQRGKGIGEALTIRALKIAENIGVKKVSLSSNSNRIAANKLYQKLGFKLRETNSYVYEIGSRE